MRFLSVYVVASLAWGWFGPVSAAPNAPNILVIYTDDQGSVDANCYGSDDLETPHIDALAATGVRFTRMLAPSAICSASRAGLLTGRFPPRAGVPANVSSAQGNPGMPAAQITLAELLRDHGYRTGHVGKWHLGYTPETMPNGQGFETSFGHMGGCIDNYSHFFYWNGPNRHDLWRDGEEVWHDGAYFGDLMIEEARRFIAEESEKPFFLYWAINWPHYPLQGTDKWRERYRDLPHPRDKYAAFMSTTDEIVGAVVDYLDELGIRDETIILFQSDHGHSVEERTFGGGGSAGPFRGHKGTLLEGGLRVPSVVSWTGTFPEGEVRDQFTSGIDWFPTLAEAAGIALPEGHVIDGKSLLGVIRDNAPSPHDSFYWRLGGNPEKAKWAVWQGAWKLLGRVSENVTPEGVAAFTAGDRGLFLVNLEEDPGETVNRAEDEPGVVEEFLALRDRYERDIAKTDPGK